MGGLGRGQSTAAGPETHRKSENFLCCPARQTSNSGERRGSLRYRGPPAEGAAGGIFMARGAFNAKICPCTRNASVYILPIKLPFLQSLWGAYLHNADVSAVPLQRGGGVLQVPSCKHLLSLAPCITYLTNKVIHVASGNGSRKAGFLRYPSSQEKLSALLYGASVLPIASGRRGWGMGHILAAWTTAP